MEQTIEWFRKQGVVLKTEEDGRMFPYSDSSQTIIDCFLDLAERLKIRIVSSCEVFRIRKEGTVFQLNTALGPMTAGTIVCASGGHSKSGAYDLIRHLGHSIIPPLPSLFTLNLPNEPIKKELQGLSVKTAEVTIEASRQSYQGPVLITHWGLSGPAVLKLSAFAARELSELQYTTRIRVNWVYPLKLHEVGERLKQLQKERHRAFPGSQPAFDLPKRLWEFLCEKSGIPAQKPWAEISQQLIHRLATSLCTSQLSMEGKTTFKEEFVTCGGVDLKEIDFKTMESRLVAGLYFCGEVINVDGITGGFNFQNAWSTAWLCAQSISQTSPVSGTGR